MRGEVEWLVFKAGQRLRKNYYTAAVLGFSARACVERYRQAMSEPIFA